MVLKYTIRIRVLPVVVAVVCGFASGVFARPSSNMISDPGFEIPSGESQWIENNWDNCIAEFERSRDKPHSGEYCQRVTILEQLGRDVQFLFPDLPVGPGSMVELRFWIRGAEGEIALRPIEVLFRRRAHPYTTYFVMRVGLTPEWHEYKCNVTLPEDTNPDDTCLMFVLAQETSFWLDDVSVRMLPSEQPGVPLEGNQVANGSFEVGRDRWYATFRESGGYVNSPIATERNTDADLRVITVPDAPDGNRVLRFEVFPKCSAAVTSAYFPLRYGHPATVGFRLKTSIKGAVLDARVGHGLFPNNVWAEERITSPNKDWNFHSFTFTPTPSTSGTYFLEFRTETVGEYLLDAVTVSEGTERLFSTRITPTVAGWEPVDDAHPANIFSFGERIAFNVRVQTEPGRELAHLTGHELDAWGREIENVEVTVPLSSQGLGQGTIELPSDRLGSFKCELFWDEHREGVPAVEIVYHVPPDLPPLKSVKDSFFGGHFQLTPNDLHIAKRGGFRWLRLHPPLCTKWLVVEPEKGEFAFSLSGAKRAKAMGFHILGTFGSVPEFYSSAQEGMATGSVFTNFAPNDWQAWEDYCALVMRVFGPYIDHWENWNEPDGGFLRVGPGQDRLDLFMKLSEHAYQAARSTIGDVTLVGGAVATLGRSLLFDGLEAGLGEYCDAVSFHHYGFTPDRRLIEKIESLSGRTGRDGKELGVWHSEGGLWLSVGGSWLKTTGLPNLGGTSMTEAAAELVKTMAVLKAIGVRKHFHYSGCGHQAGRIVYRNDCANLIDINGIPHAVFGAHAAAVLLLEGAEGKGFEERKVDNAILSVARFEREGKPILVVWSDRPVPLDRVAEFDPGTTKVFDMMGNGIDVDDATGIEPTPVYVMKGFEKPVGER
jgi:hypothetical protein